MAGHKLDKSKGVYDDEGPLKLPSEDPLHSRKGLDPTELADMERQADAGSTEDLKNKDQLENTPNQNTSSTKQKSASKQKTSDNDSEDSGMSIKNRIKGLARKHGKKAAIGGTATGGIIGVAIGIFSIASGPFQAIHAAQLLQGFHFSSVDNFSDNISGKFVIYALAGKAAKGRLGVVSNTYADRWEKRLNDKSGLKSVYSPTTQRLIGYQIIEPGKARNIVADLEADGVGRSTTLGGGGGSARPVGIDGNPVDANGDFIDMRSDNARKKRIVTRTITKSMNINMISSKIGSRLLIKRAGVNFSPMKNVTRKQADDFAKWREEKKAEKARQIETGTVTGEDSPSKQKRKEIASKIQSAIQTAKGPLIVATAVCGTQSFADGIDAQNLENQQQLIRFGMDTVSMGSQVQSGVNFNAEILGVYNERYHDPVTGTSLTDDPGMQHEMGERQTGKDYLEDVKPGSKEPPLVFRVAQRIPTLGICSAIETAAGLPIIEQTLAAMNASINAAFALFGLQSPDEYAAIAMRYFATGAVDVAAQGALAGGQANVGTFMAANNQMLAMGGREMTAQEKVEVKNEGAKYLDESFADAGLYERYADIYNPRSLAATTLRGTPVSHTQLFASLSNMPSYFASTTMKLFGFGSASAQTTPSYDYGFPMLAFSVAEMNDPAYENPFEIEEYILQEDRLERLNDDYGVECYDMTISREGDLTYGESKDFTKLPEKCHDASNTELTYYRFYRAHIINSHGLACAEGDEDSCDQLIGGGNTPGDEPVPGGTGDVAEAFAPSDHLVCTIGVDGGIQDGYHKGQLIRIRVCIIEGIDVNVRIEQNTDAVIKAAQAAGFTLRGGGFRTMTEQRNLYNQNCNNRTGVCKPSTARPGYSNHQMGLAIDWNTASMCHREPKAPCDGNPPYEWMKANAATYGLQNNTNESWHWSVDGK